MKDFLLSLAHPLGLTWTLMVAGAVWLVWRKNWRTAILLCVPTLLLFIFGSTPLAANLVAREEARYARISVRHFMSLSLSNRILTVYGGAAVGASSPAPGPDPPFSAIVVLGGGIYPSEHDAYGLRFAHGTSRILSGIILAQQSAATNLVLGGASSVGDEEESAKVQYWIESFKLPGITITNLGICDNTYAEARAFKRMQKSNQWPSALLVTSAMHMTRSLAVFRKLGIDVEPVACDFRLLGSRQPSLCLIPRQENLNLWSLYLHEKIGWLVYRLRGWI